MNINQHNVFGDNNFYNDKPHRHLNNQIKNDLQNLLKINEPVKIISKHGDGEAYAFGNEIIDFLVSKGFVVANHETGLAHPPIVGEHVDPVLENGYRIIHIGERRG